MYSVFRKGLSLDLSPGIILGAFLALISAAGFSQVPQAFKYQAVARDNTGAIIANQSVSFRMSVIQGTLPGTVVYSETHNATTNGFGLATLEIGKGIPVSGVFSAIDWSINPKYLKTELDPAGGSSYVNMGTSELLSVPYAMQAGSAPDEDWVVSGANLYPAVNGNVGLGVASPTQKLHVNGNMRLSGALYDLNNQAGTSGQVLSSTAGGTDWINLPSGLTGAGLGPKVAIWKSNSTLGYANSFHFDTINNRLGLGTTSPAAGFHLFNGAGGGGGSYNPGLLDAIIEDNDYAYLELNGSSYAGITFNDDNESVRAGLLFSYSNDAMTFRTGGFDNRMVISEQGNVGIGTNVPSTLLHVYGGPGAGGGIYSGLSDLIVEDNDYAYLELNGGSYAGVAFNDDNTAIRSGMFFRYSDDALTFITAGVDDRLVITETGNIGINQSIPTQKLHITGNMRLTGSLYDVNNTAGTGGQILSATGAGIDWIDNPSPAGTGAANKVAIWTGPGVLGYNSNLHWNNDNGYLGIGTNNPVYKLHILETSLSRGLYVSNETNANGNVGVFGFHNAGNNATNLVAGVYGQAYGYYQPNSFGVAGHNYYDGTGVGAWSYNGDLIRAYDGDWPGGALRFYITNSGNAYIDGSWLTFKGVPSKGTNQHVAMAATQSPEALLEDCGSAELVNGTAVVMIDETFTEIANTVSNYQVFLTPVSEDIVVMVISNKTPHSFAVKGVTMDGKPATCSFDYRIVARDNESKGGRFEKVNIPESIEVFREE